MRNSEITRIIHAAEHTPWAILETKLIEIREFLIARLNGAEISAEERDKLLVRAESQQRYQQLGSVAVIPVFGTISQRMNMLSAMSGGTSTEMLTKQIRDAAADPSISAIVLNVDSPGGTVQGVTEAHAAILQAREQKPVVASVNAMAGSAAYWLASAASEISITPSGSAGSVGVFAMHKDLSGAAEQEGVKVTYISAGKNKTLGNPFEPLSEEARTYLQGMVDDAYAMFVKDVAKGRGVAVSEVKSNFGEGKMLDAKDALSAGMVDKVESFDQTVARVSRAKATGGSRRALQDRLEMGAKFI